MSAADWYAEAACRGMDPDVFFPERGDSLEPARAVCRSCPVQDPCREAGLSEKWGVWAGLSERQRRRLKATRRRQRLLSLGHGTAEGYDRHRQAGESPCDACGEAKRAVRAGQR